MKPKIMTYIITAQVNRDLVLNQATTPEQALYDVVKTYFKNDFDTYADEETYQKEQDQVDNILNGLKQGKSIIDIAQKYDLEESDHENYAVLFQSDDDPPPLQSQHFMGR